MEANAQQLTEGVVTIEEEPHNEVFPPFDATTYPSQLLWLAVSFGLLYYLMSRIALPRIAGILETRRDRIAGDLAEAERLRQETDKAINAYEEALSEARSKAHELAQTTRDELNSKVAAKRASVEAELSEKLDAAEENINAIKSKALNEVGSIAEETTIAVVEAVSGLKITSSQASDAVQKTMNKS